MGKAKFSMKYKLASVILIILLPLALFSIHHYRQMVEDGIEQVNARNLAISSNTAKDLDEILGKSFGILKALSEHPAVKALDADGCDRLFAKLLPAYPDHLNIFLADMDGNNRGSGAGTPKARRFTYRDREWFTAARKGYPVVGDLYISRLFKIPAVMVAMPVFGGKKEQIGVIGMPLDLRKITDEIRDSRKLPEKTAITVVDSKGNVLIDTSVGGSIGRNISDEPAVRDILGDLSGNREAVDRDGIRRLHSFSTPASARWKVIISAPSAEAYGMANRMSAQYALVLLVIGLVAVGLAALLSARITKNLSALTAGLKEIEQGNLSFQLKLSGHDELTDVARSFNRMAEKRQAAEVKARESEQFLSSVLDGIGEGVIVIDRDYRIVAANKGYCDQMKTPRDRVVGSHCYEVSHRLENPCHEEENGCDCTVRKCFETGERHRAVHTHYDSDGKPVYIETNAYPLKDAEGNVHKAVETLTNISEKKALEAQLFQAQKMEAVGLLAGGVAHDFNNLLTAIFGYGTMLSARSGENEPAKTYIREILSAAERAAELTRSLLTFSRKQVINARPVLLSEILERVGKLLKRVIGEDIELKLSISSREASILADSTQIEQVLLNLATNARDAMPGGGTLLIETGRVEIGDEYVKEHPYFKRGPYMLVSVTDTGHGMDARTQEKIFEPFFTTKETGKGTGLGLAIVYGIVKQHNGYLHVSSEPGKGTTFKLFFPVTDAEAASVLHPVVSKAVKGTETVLVAEDDAAVRQLACTALEAYGYTVVLAEDGEDAVRKFKEATKPVDLVVLDIIMPKMNGKVAYEEIKKLRPDVKAVFMSGYTADIVNRQGILETDMEFIVKPFPPNALLRKVREILDNRIS
jgi:PAS domain S-box-containing protein